MVLISRSEVTWWCTKTERFAIATRFQCHCDRTGHGALIVPKNAEVQRRCERERQKVRWMDHLVGQNRTDMQRDTTGRGLGLIMQSSYQSHLNYSSPVFKFMPRVFFNVQTDSYFNFKCISFCKCVLTHKVLVRNGGVWCKTLFECRALCLTTANLGRADVVWKLALLNRPTSYETLPQVLK